MGLKKSEDCKLSALEHGGDGSDHEFSGEPALSHGSEEIGKICMTKRKKDLDEGNLDLRLESINPQLSSCALNEDEEKKKARLMRNRESMHSTIAELNSKISYVMTENAGLRQQLSGSGMCQPPPPATIPVVNDIFGNVEGVPGTLAFVGDRLYNQNRGRGLRVSKYSNLSRENSDTLNLLIWTSSELFEKRVFWEEFDHDYASFLKELGVLRTRADRTRSRGVAFHGHMTIGRVLYEHQLFKEALVSFKRACELQPTDVRPHFRARNCLYVLGKYKEAKEEFLLALEAAEAKGNQWEYLLLFFVLHILEL
ncbi:putative TPR repeat-containing protein, partial [Cucurbita argyrosperma subsp. sororia]